MWAKACGCTVQGMTATNLPGPTFRAYRPVTAPLGRRRRWCALATLVACVLLPPVTSSAAPLSARRAGSYALAVPWSLTPFPGTASAGQGRWGPVGRPVDGRPVIYETTLQPPQDPGTVAGVAWMDTKLLRPVLYSGSLSPGGYGWKYTAPVQGSAAQALVVAFNGGFQFPSTDGGYFSESKMVFPLRVGAASLVIYKNGAAMIGEWGRDARMTRNVVAVRQNLNLLVDNGQAVPGLNPNDIWTWGPTLGGIPNVWRSGLGETANGAFVYVAGPSLTVVDLASLLVQAGAVRAMELDINPYWTVFATYSPPTPTAAATPQNGADLLLSMAGTPWRFFDPAWDRDFIAMLARPA